MGKSFFPTLSQALAEADKMAATGWAYAVLKETYSRGFYRCLASGRTKEDRATHYRVLAVYDLGHADRPILKTGGCETWNKPSNAPALARAEDSLSPCLGGTR